MRVVLLVDEAASDEQDQSDALAVRSPARLGGPLGELAQLTGDLAAVEPAAISFVVDNDAARLDVPGRVAVRSKRLARVDEAADHDRRRNAGDAARDTWRRWASRGAYQLNVEAAAIDLDVDGRSTTTGRFSYAHRG